MWYWAEHLNRFNYKTDGPHADCHDKKGQQGRPAKRWRDDLDNFRRNTIWQRTARYTKYRLTWRLTRLTPNHGTLYGCPNHFDDDDYYDYCDGAGCGGGCGDGDGDDTKQFDIEQRVSKSVKQGMRLWKTDHTVKLRLCNMRRS